MRRTSTRTRASSRKREEVLVVTIPKCIGHMMRARDGRVPRADGALTANALTVDPFAACGASVWQWAAFAADGALAARTRHTHARGGRGQGVHVLGGGERYEGGC